MKVDPEIEELRKRLLKERVAKSGAHPRYSEETRTAVVRFAETVKNISALARQLDLNVCTLASWLKKPLPKKIILRKLTVTDETLPKNDFVPVSRETIEVVLKNGVLLRGLSLNKDVLSLLSGMI